MGYSAPWERPHSNLKNGLVLYPHPSLHDLIAFYPGPQARIVTFETSTVSEVAIPSPAPSDTLIFPPKSIPAPPWKPSPPIIPDVMVEPLSMLKTDLSVK